MTSRPDDERIARLPVWAQLYIHDLQRQRDTAVETLSSWEDEQTEGPISLSDLVSDGARGKGPTFRKRYIHGSSSIEFRHAGIRLEVSVHEEGRISLRYSRGELSCDDVGLIPRCSGSIDLMLPENMRQADAAVVHGLRESER